MQANDAIWAAGAAKDEQAARSYRVSEVIFLAWPPPSDWRETLQAHGALCLRGVPCDGDNRALRHLGAQLGEPSARALAQRAGLVENAIIQRVEARQSVPADHYGKPLKSASSAAFDLHTDESFLADPARWVLLHCWRPAAVGGETRLSDARRVWADADRVLRIALTQYRLTYPFGEACSIGADGRVRFNRAELCQARSAPDADGAADWPERLQTAFDRAAFTLTLVAGDLLMVDNWRMLHGRSAFALDGGRLLKRLRIV